MGVNGSVVTLSLHGSGLDVVLPSSKAGNEITTVTPNRDKQQQLENKQHVEC